MTKWNNEAEAREEIKNRLSVSWLKNSANN